VAVKDTRTISKTAIVRGGRRGDTVVILAGARAIPEIKIQNTLGEKIALRKVAHQNLFLYKRKMVMGVLAEAPKNGMIQHVER